MLKSIKNIGKYAILLAVVGAMLLSSISCGGGDTDDNTDGDVSPTATNQTPDGEQTTESEEEARKNISDDLPEANLNGRDFKIVGPEWLTAEFYAEAETGETVNDAIFRRNAAVAERFNVNLIPIKLAGTWDDRTSFMNTIKNSVRAGVPEYDMVASVTSYLPALVTDGIFADMASMSYFDFAKPWWGEDLTRELSIGDKLYLITGDIALSMWDSIYVFYFNKQVVQDNAIPSLYDIVKNNQWTYEKFVELSKIVSRDVNGDDKYDTSDMFGFVTSTSTVANAFAAAFNMRITSKDENNIPYPDMETAKWSEIAEKLYELHYGLPSSLTLPDSSSAVTDLINMLQENRALFFPQTLSISRSLREMEADFGILPFPMYDSSQDKYYSAVRNAMSLIGVPVTASSFDDCSLIMEALAAESYRTIVPAYYDVALKMKHARDVESGEMLDIIRDGLWMNFGYSYSLSVGGIGNYIREMIEQKNPNFISTYDKTFPSRLKTFDKFIQDVINLSQD